jgi:tape measure domain-containing protein
MADQTLNVGLTLTADNSASPEVAKLTAELDRLKEELAAQQSAVRSGEKDWLDYTQQLSGTAESMTNIVSTVEDVLIKTVEISAAVVVYQKWRVLVEGVKDAYSGLQAVLADGTGLIDAGWAEAQLQAAKLEVTIANLGSRFLGLAKIGEALSLAGVALTIAQIGTAINDSNEKTRLLTEQIGGLTASLQTLDPASLAVVQAKERFEELTKASLALKVSTEDLLPQYKAFFDLTQSGFLSVKKEAEVFTDFNQVQKNLRATSAETANAQALLNDAFESGLTTVPKLGAIFGSSLNPAMDAVAKQMGMTREQLEELINTGRIGSEDILPALTAAANEATKGFRVAGESAEFSKKQFADMGLSFYDLANKQLPGVDNALQHTATQIATTVNASVDPIGAAIEQIVNFGRALTDLTQLKQGLSLAFSGSGEPLLDWGKFIKEMIYGLDYSLIAIKEGFVAAGESIKVFASTAEGSKDQVDGLDNAWKGMQDRLQDTRAQLQEYIKALEGMDNAQGRTADGAKTAADALKSLIELPLPAALQTIIDQFDRVGGASEKVSAVWKELGSLDFTGENLRNLVLLAHTIDEVSSSSQDATGTMAAFSQQLSQLPTTALTELLAHVQKLSPLLEASGNQGVLMGTVLGAVFDKLGLDADTAGGKVTQYGRDGAAAFVAIAQAAQSTGPQIRSALAAALDIAKTQADVDAISAEFKKLGDAGVFSAQLIADGQAMVARRLTDLQNQIPGVKDGLKALGVDSVSSLQALANSAEASFQQIKAGGATVEQLRAGFLAWSEAVLKAAIANDSTVPSVLRNVAASLDMSAALDQLIEKLPRLNQAQQAQIQQTELNKKGVADFVAVMRQEFTAQEDTIQQEIALAQAKGQTGTVRRLQIDLLKLEAQHTLALSQFRQAEIGAEQVAEQRKLAALQTSKMQDDETLRQIGLIQLKLVALGEEAKAQEVATQIAQFHNDQLQQGITNNQQNVKYTQQNTQATQQNTQATQQNTEAQGGAGEMLKNLTELLGRTRAEMDALSSSARTFFDMNLALSLGEHGIAGGFDEAHKAQVAFTAGLSAADKAVASYRKEVLDADATIQHMDQSLLFAFNGFQIWEESILKAAAQTKKAFYEQKIAVESIQDSIANLSESGRLNMAALETATQAANTEFTLLDDKDLAGLRSAIADATSKLKDMQDAAQSAKDRITELNAEIAAEKGDTATSDRLKLQLEQTQALAEVEAKLAEAQQQNNRELIALYEEQRRQLQALYDLKQRHLEQDIKTRASAESSPATAAPTSGALASEARGVSITVNANGARVLDKSFVEDLSRQLQPEFARMFRLAA